MNIVCGRGNSRTVYELPCPAVVRKLPKDSIRTVNSTVKAIIQSRGVALPRKK